LKRRHGIDGNKYDFHGFDNFYAQGGIGGGLA